MDNGDKIVVGIGCARIVDALASVAAAIAIVWAIVVLVMKYGWP